ncbi:MAG: hypothetical protein U5L74_15530 [Ideonella sp.]|nr:hypothetical protein [Ideonella sp.]
MAELTRLSERQALAVGVLRSLEQAPDASTLWRHSDAQAATDEALALQGRNASLGDFLARRAQCALDTLQRRGGAAAITLSTPAWPSRAAWLLCAVAAVAGGLADYLDGRHVVNFLEFHLLGLIAWNVLVYGLTMLSWAWACLPGSSAPSGGLNEWLGRRWFAAAVSGGGGPTATWFKSCQSQWAQLAAPLSAARLGMALHAGAMAFALGLVCAMYARGLPQQYSSAAVASTWLDAAQLQQLFNGVMSPGAWLLGLPLPQLQDLAQAREPGALHSLARQLFHLHAAALLVWVLLPRLALFGLQALRRWRWRHFFALSLNAPYFTTLRLAWRKQRIAVAVVPFRYEVHKGLMDALHSLLHRVYGQAVDIATYPAVLMGEDAQDWKRTLHPDGQVAVLVIFNITATAEPATHAALLRSLRKAVAAGTPVLALVDVAAFPAHQEARLESRRQQWRQVLDAVGVRPLFMNLSTVQTEDLLSLEHRLTQHE